MINPYSTEKKIYQQIMKKAKEIGASVVLDLQKGHAQADSWHR